MILVTDLTITILGVAITAAVTYLVQIVLRYLFTITKKGKSEQNKEIILGLITPELEATSKKLDNITAKLETSNEGTQALLRDRLLALSKECTKKGYKTQNESDNFHKLYKSYHTLNGNSFIDDDVKPKFEKLDLRENED